MTVPKEKPHNFTYTYWSIHLLNITINELEALYKVREKEHEFALVGHPMFKVFHMTLMYAVIMEYCKLLEGLSNSGNVASLAKLSSVVLHSNPDFKANNDYIQSKITTIKASGFFKKIIKLRDKKYAHSDNHSISTPFSIKSLTDEEMRDLKSHFKELLEIHQLCADVFDTHYDISHRNDETENFITQYAKMRKYYKENNKTPWLDV